VAAIQARSCCRGGGLVPGCTRKPDAIQDGAPNESADKETFQMPLAKIHVLEGRYDERRLSNVSKTAQDALISINQLGDSHV